MVVQSDSDVHRLLDLNQKIKSGTASKAEKDAYMKMLRQQGSITEKQYNDYIQGRNVEDIVSAALIIGGILLLGYLLTRGSD